MRTVAVGLLLFSLFGCGRVPLTSMIRLNRLDPMTVNATHIRAAVRMPDAMRVKPDGARLTWSAKRDDIAQTIKETFVLEHDFSPTVKNALNTRVKPGFRIEIFRIAEPELEKLTTFRQRVAAWKQQDPDDTEGSLSIDIVGCRLGPLPSGKLLVSTYLKMKADGQFITLTRDTDLRGFAPGPFGDQQVARCDGKRS